MVLGRFDSLYILPQANANRCWNCWDGRMETDGLHSGVDAEGARLLTHGQERCCEPYN